MFSTQEYQYIKDLTQDYYKNGYEYYLCYTNNPNNSYNQSYYDIYCYYSKNEITINNGNYIVNNSNTKYCSIDTKSPTSTYKNNSLVCNNSGGTITINQKEFIYSNVGNNANIIQEYESNINNYKNMQLYTTAILMVIILMFLYKFIRSIIAE